MSINLKTKLQLTLMFALGVLVTICSIVKATYILPIQSGHDSSPFVILSNLEICVGVSPVCGSIYLTTCTNLSLDNRIVPSHSPSTGGFWNPSHHKGWQQQSQTIAPLRAGCIQRWKRQWTQRHQCQRTSGRKWSKTESHGRHHFPIR